MVASDRAQRWTWFVLWLAALLALWTAAWILHEKVLVPRGWAVGSWSEGLYWTVAKLAVWIAPALAMLRRAGQSPGAATGLGTTRGLGRGLAAAGAWVGVLVVWSGLRGVWPTSLRSPGGYAALNAFLIAPLFEELVFRGFALRRLRGRGVRFWPAALATSVAFGLLHVPGWLVMKGAGAALSSFGPVMMLGVVLAAVSWRIPSLWACVAVHFANNAWDGGLVLAFLRSIAAIAR